MKIKTAQEWLDTEQVREISDEEYIELFEKIQDDVAADFKRIVNEEDELPGAMPDDIWNLCQTREGATEVLRANIRATKINLLKKLREIK